VVDYRHLIHALKRKPMALLNLVYREQLFPRQAYRRAFHARLDRHGEREACRVTVQLLALAHERGCEAALAGALEAILEAGTPIELNALHARFAPDPRELPQVNVQLGSLEAYNALLERSQREGAR
jgi:hypothetical protein